MATPPIGPKPSPTRAGALAQEQLIEAAGQMFADQGYDGATSRDICIRAGMNGAAVNYHFGGIEALCSATLAEANRRVLWNDALEEIAASELPARERLRAILRPTIRSLVDRAPSSWATRLLGRELVAPKSANYEFFEVTLRHQRQTIAGLIAEITGRSIDDPVVGRCLVCAVAPIAFLAIADRKRLAIFIPDIDDLTVGALAAQVEDYVLAGIEGASAG